MSDLLLGAHGPNHAWTEEEYRRLQWMQASVVGMLWTGDPTQGGTHHRRAEYEEIERRCPSITYSIRVGPSHRITPELWVRYMRAAAAEIPQRILDEGRAIFRVLNEVNLQEEGDWSGRDYALFLRQVVELLAAEEWLLCAAPISLGRAGWRDWWAEYLETCGGQPPTPRQAINCYAHLVGVALEHFVGLRVALDCTEVGTLGIEPGAARAAWVVAAAQRMADAGWATCQQFILGAEPGTPPAWDGRYRMNDDEAAALGRLAHGRLHRPDVPAPEPPPVVVDPPAPEEPTVSTLLSLSVAMRQGSDQPAARQTVGGLVHAVHRGHLTTAIMDTRQGRRIQGTFSHTPIDFQSRADMVRIARALWTEGILLAPMVNPFGADPEGEADDAAGDALAIANAIGRATVLAVDREHDYAGFWRLPYYEPPDPQPPPFFPAGESPARWRRYVDRLETKLAGLPWVLVPDPQQVGRDYAAGDTPDDVDFLLQSYWTLYQLPWRTMLERFVGSAPGLARYGEHRIVPGIPGSTSSVDLEVALAWLREHGWRQAWVWDLGSLVDYDLDLLAAASTTDYRDVTAMTTVVTPAPTGDPRGPLWDRVYTLARSAETAAGEFRRFGTHADLITANTLAAAGAICEAAYQSSKVMREVEPDA